MSDYTAIADVGETLVELLRGNMQGLIPADSIALVSPGEIEGKDNIRLSLFLYQVNENINLRNMEMENMGPSRLKAPPLALDLDYMLTSYPSPGIQDRTERTEEEHSILGRAMQVMHDNSVLAGSVLKGSLSAHDIELHVAVTSLSLDDMSKIWSTFKEKSFRPSVCYQVTPVKIESSREKKISRVTSGPQQQTPERREK
ncbi:MAG: DUF4255 domain-containing protein [Methanosarcina sp.]|uniref:DUF4255 domain-containing protein n=1 Tax=Methanosarcina sp. TaxID=2213 RepID=UPI00261DC587|nr:DUF4255 domain-containing protein [Methanosarcina sp.]MDD3246403.1 DUF4255 domain-containing protein [Methanosarcina sp.]MDD4248309.1 DUF4255 domain-containing protein [Methanosarcina sp.]